MPRARKQQPRLKRSPAPIPEDDPELLAMAAEKSFSSKIWDSAQSHDASALAAEITV